MGEYIRAESIGPMTQLMRCADCGALILPLDYLLHDEFHERLTAAEERLIEHDHV